VRFLLRRHLLPCEDRHGLPPPTRLLEAITEAWTERRHEIEARKAAQPSAHLSPVAIDRPDLPKSLAERCATWLWKVVRLALRGFARGTEISPANDSGGARDWAGRGTTEAYAMAFKTLDAAGDVRSAQGAGHIPSTATGSCPISRRCCIIIPARFGCTPARSFRTTLATEPPR